MKLEEAIEIAELERKGEGSPSMREYGHALSLLIEAGKRELLLRSEIPYDRDGLLPGETKD